MRAPKKLHVPTTQAVSVDTSPHEIMIRAIQRRAPNRRSSMLLGTSKTR
jgi:hypothetical protein